MLRVLVIVAAFALVAGCSSKKSAPPAKDAAQKTTKDKAAKGDADKTTAAKVEKHAAACTCSVGKKGGTVWCEKCGSGYVKGEKSKDKAAVDAALKVAGPTHDAACTCSVGKAGGTVWCEKCGSGYVKGEKSKDKAAVEAALKASK